MTRYLIAILIPEPLGSELRIAYQREYSEPCRVRTIHLTFIPPFTVTDPQVLNSIQTYLDHLPPINALFSFAEANVFHQAGRTILYLPVLPIKPLTDLYQILVQSFHSLFMVESSEPNFLPHVTLNYNFKNHISPSVLISDPFTLPPPSLLLETGPGIWEPTEPHKL